MRVDVIEAGFAAAQPGRLRCDPGDRRGHQGLDRLLAGARQREAIFVAAGEAIKPAKCAAASTPSSPPPDPHGEEAAHEARPGGRGGGQGGASWALEYTDDVEFSAEDAVRSDIDFLCRIFDAVIKAGAKTLNVPDTVGYSIPAMWGERMKQLIERVPNADKVIWSTHCHNDLGMAVGQLAGRGAERRAPGRVHHQRPRRACRQCLAGRNRHGGAHAQGSVPAATRVSTRRRSCRPRKLVSQITGYAGAAEQGHRRRQCLRPRVGHPSGRRAQASRDLRDHARRGRGLERQQAVARQALRPQRLQDQAGRTRHRARQRGGAQYRLRPLQGARRQEARDLRRGSAGARFATRWLRPKSSITSWCRRRFHSETGEVPQAQS